MPPALNRPPPYPTPPQAPEAWSNAHEISDPQLARLVWVMEQQEELMAWLVLQYAALAQVGFRGEGAADPGVEGGSPWRGMGVGTQGAGGAGMAFSGDETDVMMVVEGWKVEGIV